MMADNQKIGSTQEWKFGLITREVYRISENFYEIDDLSDGWKTATVTKETMNELVQGKESLLNLDWT